MFVASEPFDEMMMLLVEDTVGPGKVSADIFGLLSSLLSVILSNF